jgi:hypothetical protein
VEQHHQTPLLALLARLRGLPHRAWSVVALGPLALTLILILAWAILLGPIGQSLHQGGAGATDQASAASPLVARADVHVETLLNGKDLEMNLAITQTENDCQAALNGGTCLRYSVVLDEHPVLVGYGVIPKASMSVTASSIVLRVDTSKVPDFVNIVGQGGPITINWKAVTSASTAKTDIPQQAVRQAEVQGSVARYAVPQKTAVPGSTGRYAIPGTTVIASILMR